ncbi:hypothetical protein [Saccharopolyspora sp. NPDC050642]|uniref:hypothetical protein n=1 Tax=Saccharopolyspora sp. NPDC050642 TaxID=3157099 RepID=UPI0033F8409A
MDLPSVPASVTTLIGSGKLPPDIAAFFTASGGLAEETGWGHVSSAVEELLAAGDVAEDVRGVLALAGAYGRLDELEDCVDPDEMDEDNDRAVELLQAAEAGGVDEDETAELWWYSDHLRASADGMREYIEEMEAYVAKHGATPRGRLEAKLGPANDLYAAGDRAAAVALFREVAETSPWDSDFSGCSDLIGVSWCRLLHDAAHTDGPEAARKTWQEARTHFRAARFPQEVHAWPLVEMLLGTGVPDIIEVIIRGWIEAAEEAGEGDVPVTEEQQRIFELALAEIEAATGTA